MITQHDIRAIARAIHPFRHMRDKAGHAPTYYQVLARITGYAETTAKRHLGEGGTAPFWRALARYLRDQATLYLSHADRLDAAATAQEERNATIAGFPRVAYRDGPDMPARCGRPLKSRAKINLI